jgi:tRNA threonylcarbamoyladenosine biosynthesis protein TsaB
MRILAVDTATEICGVGLSTTGKLQVELSFSHGETHARHLMEGVRSVLDLAGISLADVDAYAVTRGPGSFTGLRIGISTVKGMAMAMGKPVAGVSSLAVLAHQVGKSEELICPMLDARRREVYWAVYRWQDDTLVAVLPEQVGPPALVGDHITGPCRFIGSGVRHYQEEVSGRLKHAARWITGENARIRVGWVASLARQKLLQRISDDIRTFGPVYLRKSDAELNFGRKAKDGNPHSK